MTREFVVLGGPVDPLPTQGPFLFSGVAHCAVAVADVDRSAQWYGEVLDMQRLWEVEDVRDDEIPAMMGAHRPGEFEAHAVALYPAGLPDGRGGTGTSHIVLRAARAHWEATLAALRDRGIDVTTKLHDLVECMFLRDPDGHLIEIITDPPAFHPRSSTNV